MVFEIDGVDLLRFVQKKGIKWKLTDKKGKNSGETMDGTMHRGRVASKVRLDVTCIPLKSEDSATVLKAIRPEYVSVKYTDPELGVVTKTMYCESRPATHMVLQDDGTEYWDGITSPLIER